MAPGHRGIKTALSAVSGWPRRPPGGRACSDGRGMRVNYPSLKGGACTGNLMETTTMQFNSPEGCFIQPYSCRPVDTASTDYPWNHGITGYLYRSPRHTSYANCGVIKTSSSGVGVSGPVTEVSTSDYKILTEGAIPPHPEGWGGIAQLR